MTELQATCKRAEWGMMGDPQKAGSGPSHGQADVLQA
jgi:hypothetical protein